MTTATKTTTIDFGTLGTFEIGGEPRLADLIGTMECGIGATDPGIQYAAREAATMLRQRIHKIQPGQC